MKSQKVVLPVGLVIGAAFLWFSARGIDFDSVRPELDGLVYSWVAVASASVVVFVFAKAYRWRVILRPVIECDLGFLARLVAVGSAANLVVTHTGELVRAVQVSRREPAAAIAVLATIGVERLLDVASILVLVVLTLTGTSRVPGELASTAVVLAMCSAVGIGLVLFWLFAGKQAGTRVLTMLNHLPPGPRNWIARQVAQGRVGLEIVKKPRVLILLIAFSIAQWAFIIVGVWASCMAIGLVAAPSSLVAVLALMVVGVTLPTAPGYLGTTQLAFVAGLGAGGVPAEQAFASSLVYSVAVNLFTIVLGAVAWSLGWRGKRRSVTH